MLDLILMATIACSFFQVIHFNTIIQLEEKGDINLTKHFTNNRRANYYYHGHNNYHSWVC